MFPCVSVRAAGLDMDACYAVTMALLPADAFRYKYINNTWLKVGKADTQVRTI
jgi:hypothetical protein